MFNLNFTREEKLLTLLPTFAAVFDYACTFFGAKDLGTLMVYEINLSIKTVVWQNGIWGLFSWMLMEQMFLFYLFLAVIWLSKKYNLDIKWVYAMIFWYVGFRFSGGISWFC